MNDRAAFFCLEQFFRFMRGKGGSFPECLAQTVVGSHFPEEVHQLILSNPVKPGFHVMNIRYFREMLPQFQKNLLNDIPGTLIGFSDPQGKTIQDRLMSLVELPKNSFRRIIRRSFAPPVPIIFFIQTSFF
jgi:hypothetical protein